jgi:hypothetical protein
MAISAENEATARPSKLAAGKLCAAGNVHVVLILLKYTSQLSEKTQAVASGQVKHR